LAVSNVGAISSRAAGSIAREKTRGSILVSRMGLSRVSDNRLLGCPPRPEPAASSDGSFIKEITARR
jgi:hypothetical protein